RQGRLHFHREAAKVAKVCLYLPGPSPRWLRSENPKNLRGLRGFAVDLKRATAFNLRGLTRFRGPVLGPFRRSAEGRAAGTDPALVVGKAAVGGVGGNMENQQQSGGGSGRKAWAAYNIVKRG